MHVLFISKFDKVLIKRKLLCMGQHFPYCKYVMIFFLRSRVINSELNNLTWSEFELNWRIFAYPKYQ